MNKETLSIVIVNYNTFKLTRDTIISVIAEPISYKYEIFLVDNNSTDGSLEELKNYFSKEISNGLLKVIANSENQGFAAANNLAIKESSGDFILLLNSDTIVKEGTLDRCMDYISSHEHDDIGALGCKVSLTNGELDKACKRSFPNPVNSFYKLFGINASDKNKDNYNLDDLDDDGIYEVDCLVGAFMLLRKLAIGEVGLLDEDYFMYGEDIDLCYRIKEGGWKIIYFGEAEILHYKGASSKKKKSKLIYEFYRAMYLFYNKHYKTEYSFLMRIAVYFGIATLLLYKLIANALKKD